jgi:hypothetical protein
VKYVFQKGQIKKLQVGYDRALDKAGTYVGLSRLGLYAAKTGLAWPGLNCARGGARPGFIFWRADCSIISS